MLRTAIDAVVVDPDDRGLMPLDDAEHIARASETFSTGATVTFQGRRCDEGARLWAALLSLSGAQDFNAHAQRIAWTAHTPDGASTAAIERYGEDLFPWLESCVDSQGWLRNLPSAVGASLSVLNDEGTFALLAGVRGIHQLPQHPELPPPRDQAPGLWDWVARYPRVGLPLLLQAALDGDRRLHSVLFEMVAREPGASFQLLASQHGARQTQVWFEHLSLPNAGPDPRVLEHVRRAPKLDVPSGPTLSLNLLDAAFRSGRKPAWDRPDRFTGAMRVTGHVSEQGDHLVFQSLETGGADDGVRVRMHAYGPRFGPQQVQDLSRLTRHVLTSEQLCTVQGELHEFHLTGVVLVWDNGWRVVRVPYDHPRKTAEIELDGELLDVDLRPPLGLETHVGPTESLMLNLPVDRVFLGPRTQLELLDLPARSQTLFEFDTWRHPFGNGAASQSRDVVAMVEALAQRRALTDLPEQITPGFHLSDRIRSLGGWGTLAAWARGVD
jgi:hypothetical protein